MDTETLALEVRLTHPRCPFCHEAVEPYDLPAPCLACRAWHHAACLGEAHQRCAACGVRASSAPATVLVRERVQVRVHASTRERAWAAMLWIAACAALLVVDRSVLPAFGTMFREVGVELPLATEVVLGAGHWLWTFGILSLLHAAAHARERPTRERLRIAAFLAGILGVALASVALFLPLIGLCSRL